MKVSIDIHDSMYQNFPSHVQKQAIVFTISLCFYYNRTIFLFSKNGKCFFLNRSLCYNQ